MTSLANFDAADFMRRHWQRSPLHIPGALLETMGPEQFYRDPEDLPVTVRLDPAAAASGNVR